MKKRLILTTVFALFCCATVQAAEPIKEINRPAAAITKTRTASTQISRPSPAQVAPTKSGTAAPIWRSNNSTEPPAGSGSYYNKAAKPFKYTVPIDEEKPILGKAVVNKKQAIEYLKNASPNAKLNCSIEELVEHYYKESEREGIAADLALAQAIVETGFFQFKGTVVPQQNNYCGLGTTNSKVKGVWFKTPQLGVRGHIQHLVAYAHDRDPKSAIVDPRYKYVRNNPKISGQAKRWVDLNGRWAMGAHYGQKILTVHATMSNQALVNDVNATEQSSAKTTFLERIQKILEGM